MIERTLGECLRGWRKEKHLLQKEAAAIFGISRVYYDRLEHEHVKPSLRLYVRIVSLISRESNRSTSKTEPSGMRIVVPPRHDRVRTRFANLLCPAR